MHKLVTFVPETHAEKVRDAITGSGAGVLGNYSNCTFSTKGIGRFRGSENSNPFIGERSKIEEVLEERIETWVDEENLDLVISAIKKVHPYEEVPIDIYPLMNFIRKS